MTAANRPWPGTFQLVFTRTDVCPAADLYRSLDGHTRLIGNSFGLTYAIFDVGDTNCLTLAETLSRTVGDITLPDGARISRIVVEDNKLPGTLLRTRHGFIPIVDPGDHFDVTLEEATRMVDIDAQQLLAAIDDGHLAARRCGPSLLLPADRVYQLAHNDKQTDDNGLWQKLLTPIPTGLEKFGPKWLHEPVPGTSRPTDTTGTETARTPAVAPAPSD